MKPEAKDSMFMSDILNPVEKFKDLKSDCYKLHYDAFVVDSHNDFIYQVYKRSADFGKRQKSTQTGLDRLIDGGIKLQVFSIWPDETQMKRAYSFCKEQIERFNKIESENSDRFRFANSFDDVVSTVESGKLCGMFGIEGGNAIENDLDRIDEFYKLGVRYIGITWNNSNKIGTSAKDESKSNSGGLTEYGYKVIRRMDDVGMMIDVSHAGEKTFWDIIKTSKNPIIASHSCCYTLSPHYRNLTDEQIKAIADRGGVVMVNFYDHFIDVTNADALRTSNLYQRYSKELDDIYKNSGGDMIKFNTEREKFLSSLDLSKGISIDKFIDHIDYIKKLVGVDYIGLGSDYDGGITPPNELYDGTCYPIITRKLVERGYTELEIRKILGLNFLRVFKQVCG
ncbi:MAG: membrane dipeptidase [Ignavibacteriae bacterium]|nr:membrane dipeptidase [Ignavibacteriota bacterium]